MIVQVNKHEAKTNLSKLVAQVSKGGEITIAIESKPIGRLDTIEQPKKSSKA